MYIKVQQKHISAGAIVFSALSFVILGIFLVTQPISALTLLSYVIIFFLGFNGILSIFSIFFTKPHDKTIMIKLLVGFSYLLAAPFVYFNTELFFAFFPIVVGLYAVFNGLIRFVVYYIYKQNDVSGRIYKAIIGFLSCMFGLVMIFAPSFNIETVVFFAGVYAIVYGITTVGDVFPDATTTEDKDKIKRRFRVTPPIVVSAFLPVKALAKFNKMFETSKIKDHAFVEIKADDEPNLEVVVHVTKDGFGAIGHVDICFDGEVISYGSYDPSSEILFGAIGDGILIRTKQVEKYYQLCVDNDKKTLFVYGLKLSEAQKDAVFSQLEKIKELAVPWMAPIQADELLGKDVNPDDYTDYASKLITQASAQLFKFRSGKFKKYFVFYTNCAMLADEAICKSGTDILGMNGVITPGSYLDYFEREFNLKDSRVISRTIFK